jgi:hypothetical protein
VAIRSTSSAIDTGSTELRLTTLRRPIGSWPGSRITSLVGLVDRRRAIRRIAGLVDLGGAVARQPRRQGLVDELGGGGASAHPSSVIEHAAIHGGAPHVAGAPNRPHDDPRTDVARRRQERRTRALG